MKAAAAELTKAASMLDIAACSDKGRGKMAKERLIDSAKDLREIAVDLEKGAGVPSLKKLEIAVAKAHVALAWHHFHAQGSTLNGLGSKLITIDTYRINSPEPTVAKFAKELEKLGADIESVAKLAAK